MKLLVLGASGQLGAELMTRARAAGHTATGPDHARLDVCDGAALEAAFDADRPDDVINTTAFHVVPDCELRPDLAFAVNAAAVRTLAERCATRGIGLLTYSTDYVFDGRKGTPYVETDAPHPLQTYGVSKLAGEQLAALFHPGAWIVRTCGVYGGPAGSRSKRGNFVLTILRDAATKDTLEVSSEQIVNPTSAADLADATLALIARTPPGGLYHLASEGHGSWAEFAAAIVAAADRSMTIVPVDRGGQSGAARRPRFSALANRAAAAHGVVLPDWREAVGRYVRERVAAGAS